MQETFNACPFAPWLGRTVTAAHTAWARPGAARFLRRVVPMAEILACLLWLWLAWGT